MKKILIATTNKDKFKIISYLLKRAGLDDDNYKIVSLEEINYDGPDNKEIGSIVERAIAKAKMVKNYLKNGEYDWIIGVDDGIRLKGNIIENVKEYLNKILYENYLSENEDFSFPRAYCIINKNDDIYTSVIEIPYIYKSRENAVLKSFSYPLSQIAVPIGYDKPIIEMTEKESNEYYWKYSEEEIKKLVANIKN